jgi:Uma2 family endonuclease
MIQIRPPARDYTLRDLLECFGPMPFHRIRHDPPPGTATEADVLEIDAHEDRLCELMDGVLVEKTVGTYESYLAVLISRLLGNYVSEHELGIVLGADGMLRLWPGMVRIPDTCYISNARFPGLESLKGIAQIVPDLAVEVISPHNTQQEMERKLSDYFTAGVRAVWYVYPDAKQVAVYRSLDDAHTLDEHDTLDGGDVVPGFRLELQRLFAEPRKATS